MLRNRLLYLAALAGGTVFYCFFYAWFSWFLLVLLWCLPALSLVVSLPAMLTMDLRLVSRGILAGERRRSSGSRRCADCLSPCAASASG